MRSFFLSLALATAAAAPLLLVPRDARAQISDSERQAARQLFNDGVALQTAGHYADALDKFTRAQRVIFAHTNLVHIGECQVQLGKWVEAAETYRLSLHTDTGGNPAFQSAQDTSRQELAALEPRIPKLKIDVTPKDAPDMQVQVDGQSVNAALLDVPMPLDPGPHKVVVFAAGYTSSEQSVSLAERDSKTVALTIVATGGVTYSNGTGNVPPPGPGTGAVMTTGTVAPPPPPPPGEGPDVARRWNAPARPPVGKGLLLGIGAGADIPSGDLASGTQLSQYAKGGGAFAISGLLRLGRFGIGLFYQYAGYGQGDAFSNDVSGMPATTTVTSNAHSHTGGVVASYISNPQGVGFYGELGFDYRAFSTSEKFALTSDSSTNAETDGSFGGPELLLGVGIWIKAGNWLRIIPKVDVTVGSFGAGSCTESTPGAGPVCPAAGFGGQPTSSTSGHAFFFLGVNGYYEAPL